MIIESFLFSQNNSSEVGGHLGAGDDRERSRPLAPCPTVGGDDDASKSFSQNNTPGCSDRGDTGRKIGHALRLRQTPRQSMQHWRRWPLREPMSLLKCRAVLRAEAEQTRLASDRSRWQLHLRRAQRRRKLYRCSARMSRADGHKSAEKRGQLAPNHDGAAGSE
jgi:hypothetical protein